jgi:cathepsin A (carboxypeptidase C)
MEALDSQFQSEFLQAASEPMVLASSGKPTGRVRTAGSDGETAGNYTFVEVFEAG